MKRSLYLVGLSLAIALATVGCGGSSSSGPSSSPNAVFAGNYVGAFTDTGSNTDSGEFAITVSQTGAISGRVIDTTSKLSALITSGQITFVSSTATTTTGTVTVTQTASGTTTGTFILSNGVLAGSLTNSAKDYTVAFTSGLTSTANANPFAGHYAGTFTYNGSAGSPANTFDAIIDGSGNITGLSQNNTTSSAVEVLTGTITNGGITNIGPVGQPADAVSGTLTLTNGTLTGTLTNATPTTIVPTLTSNS